VVTSGVSRLRSRIRDQIHARDVAYVIHLAESTEHLQAILADNAETLGLLQATVCHEGERDLAVEPPGSPRRACRLDLPILSDEDGDGDPLLLSVWWDSRPEHWRASERIAEVLAAAIADWRRANPLAARAGPWSPCLAAAD
jgi:hypothetical protein